MKTQMIKLIESWGSDNLNRFGGVIEGGINLQQNTEELVDLLLFLSEHKPDKINYLEVGCAAGGLTYIMNYFLNLENIVLIDDGLHVKHIKLEETLKGIDYIKYIGNSQSDDAHKFIYNLNLVFDIIFIDADHSYMGVSRDTIAYKPFLSEGGFMVFHDINTKGSGIKEWVNNLPKNLKLKNIANFSIPHSGLGIGVYQ